MRSDTEIKNDVQEQLNWEPLLNAAEIGVAVKKGIVTLSGQVDSYLKKVTAERTVKKVMGVKAVAEDLQVGPSSLYKRTDTEIAEVILDTIKWHLAIQEDKIKFEVENGIVTLEGEVDWEYQRKAIETAVESIIGVRNINNCILVKPQTTPADIKHKIHAAFRRSANIDSEKISVDVIGNKIVLKGKVRSIAERDDAENAAWSAPGISKVENYLELEMQELVL